MEIRQKTELRHLLVPELRQSLKILTLSLLELKAVVEEELNSNPLLEESPVKEAPTKTNNPEKEKYPDLLPFHKYPDANINQGSNLDFRLSLITKKVSLQDILLRQLGMFTDTDEEFSIGQEIIGNINENGYLKASLEEIAINLNVTIDKVENVLKLIQQFEPAGVASRSIPECLLIQLKLANELNPLTHKIVQGHLEDIAKKNYTHIAKALKEPLDKIEPLIKKILKLDPKPGRNYSAEEAHHIIPDVVIDEKNGELKLTINDEDIPVFNINKDYMEMLKKSETDPATKEFLRNKLTNALELLRAISKRKRTLSKIMEAIVEIQAEAIRQDLSYLKPLTFQELAQKIKMHESTVCRAIMNKYVKLPFGIVALKDFFSSHVHDTNGESISSSHIKKLLKELIEQEDKKHPLSDEDIVKLLANKKINISRRTVAKYREELKILSTVFRREK